MEGQPTFFSELAPHDPQAVLESVFGYRDFRPGQRVMLLLGATGGRGTWMDQVVVPASMLWPTPERLTDAQAGALWVNYLSVWVMAVEVLTPDDFLGDVIGDLNQRRGRILGIEAAGRAQRVRALVPQSELYKYATSLRSLTQGRAAHSRKFHAYEELPHAEVPKVVETARREREAELAAR